MLLTVINWVVHVKMNCLQLTSRYDGPQVEFLTPLMARLGNINQLLHLFNTYNRTKEQ